MQRIILLTGATGFLGTYIANKIIGDPQLLLIALVRAVDNKSATLRLKKEWWDYPNLCSSIGKQVQPLAGDITLNNLGLDATTYQHLSQTLTHIIHSAADVRLFQPQDLLHLINVGGTGHVLDLARAVQLKHGLTCFVHVSTAYVAGARSGRIFEEPCTDQFGFSSPYEYSKYAAEQLVWKATSELPICIVRPGMIVGDSQHGRIKTFNTLYFPLRLYLTGRLSIAPARHDLRVNLVPVDYVADAICKLIDESGAIGKAFHLTPPKEDMPTLRELTNFARIWTEKEMGIRLRPASFLPWPGLAKLTAHLARFSSSRDLVTLASLLPYFEKDLHFERNNTDELVGIYPHRWQDLLPVILQEAVQRSFWHRTTRSVHEQVLVRLQSKNKPIMYHDLSQGQIIKRSGSEIQTEIRAIRASFKAMDIKSGDRVAIIGVNSSRYFSILMACGLSGIVSAPFYATCPPKEINQLLEHSQPRLLFIGVPALLSHLGELFTLAPLVSFCTKLAQQTGDPIMSWDEFLQLGDGQPDVPSTNIQLDQPVSLHYTSGTTGDHKGVIYLHHHHRWLAETLASMFPWHERNRKGSYLSYLPMNHVVEGILATYSPYYVPAALDLYFLDEFNDLQWALQKVHPTIFFSVPRFFEKVRATFLENSLARLYICLPDNVFRSLLKPLLRTVLLKKTGLNKCKLIIVGSATTDPALLAFYQDLGIEVHNAYGLTEAPLVSLNRLGHNRIDTLGNALPETQIRIKSDGEICVRGPQVAAGYFNHGAIEPFPDDSIDTGDLGSFEGGYLKMSGRKKDVLVTSYAKNIYPTLIEANLRAIPGIGEALLIADGHPYCTALLWLDENTWIEKCLESIKLGIELINANHAHPEQIKRWAVMPGILSAEDGSMTGSMKIRRGILTQRYNTVIEALYNGNLPKDVLYCGGLPKES
ncbi:MAG: long-chain fatty acid--CoA ligase [Chloroflexi bacterium HGW-Chloroflexi-10]|nr:MAG: long-chain fatty acid--CoA ligase [Chloroflexi bacterium HGW-Chloroflexi-10]